jgi:mRNA-degrading endonuclease toxin of MazEF toxin-antitoxin module
MTWNWLLHTQVRWSTTMPNKWLPSQPTPRRGEIWTAYLAPGAQQRHWVLVVSPNARNLSNNALTVLIVPFASRLDETPTTLVLPQGETGLPGPSCVRAHFITTLPKSQLVDRLPRSLSATRMREIALCIRRSFEIDAPY